MSRIVSSHSGLKKYLISYGVSLLICFVVIMTASVIIYSMNDPDSALRIAAAVSLPVSFAASGFASAKITGKMFSGLAVSAALLITLFLISIVFFERSATVGYTLAFYGAAFACSALGGLIGGGKRRAKHHRAKYAYRKR